ncbi:PH domain-containing protein [Thalassiella azotivora]
MSTDDDHGTRADHPEATATRSPFDPAGVRWTPVSPRLVTARRLVLAVTVVLPLVALVVLAVLVSPWFWAGAAALTALAGWLLWLIGRQVRAIGYAEQEDDLLIRTGVMFRTLVVVPYGRMQYVDVQAGPLDRALGLARVQLHTASPGTDAAIPGLPPEEAARLRERLATRGEARLAGL